MTKITRPFSYNRYKQIITKLKSSYPLLDYSEINNKTVSFCVIRHDVEFSVERAHKVAVIEKELGVNTSFFFQITNNTYNIFSEKNFNLLNDIKDLGHKIGLHFSSRETDSSRIRELLLKEIKLLSSFLNEEIERFSFHRPNQNIDLIKSNIEIPGIINVYGPLFFSYHEKIPANPKIKYISDSQHQWNYGNPLDLDTDVKRLHILSHPYSWSERGMKSDENFESLIMEKEKELIKSMSNECKHFPEGLFDK